MNKVNKNLVGILAASALATGCATHGKVDQIRDIGFLGYEQERIISDKCKEEDVLKPFIEENLTRGESIENCIDTHNEYYNDGAFLMGKLIEHNYNKGTLGSGIPTPSNYFAPTTQSQQRLNIANNIYSQMVENEGGQELFVAYLTKAAEEGARISREDMRSHFIKKDLVATAILTGIASTYNAGKTASNINNPGNGGSSGSIGSGGSSGNVFDVVQ